MGLTSMKSMEEYLAHQLAVIGLQLHKLGRFDSYRRVIDARNDLLDILDEEFVPQGKETDASFALENAVSVERHSRPKRSELKATDRLR